MVDIFEEEGLQRDTYYKQLYRFYIQNNALMRNVLGTKKNFYLKYYGKQQMKTFMSFGMK